MEPMYITIPIDKIRVSRSNMRVNDPFGDEEDQELIENIKTQGIIQPINVRPVGDMYEVDVGRRRFLAAKLAGLEEIPCTVREMTDDEAMNASFSENMVRKDADAVTLGWWVVKKQEMTGMSLRELAQELGISDMALGNYRATTKLTEEMQNEVQRGVVSRKNALKILKMNLTPDEERALAEESRTGGFKVFKKALDRVSEGKEKRGAPRGLLITRINWGPVSPEYETLKRFAESDGLDLSEYCQKILTDHIQARTQA